MGSRLKFKAALIFFIITLFSFSAADDAAVMSKLFAAISPAPKGWSVNTSFCTWTNVNCDSSQSSVTSINLASQSLTGTLPSEIGSLTQLTSHSLQRNSFSGPIPSLSSLTNLQEIYLDSNKFSSIPTNFFQGLTSLQTFSLSDNSDLSPWTIPADLTQASGLVTFSAANASIFGSLPDIFGSLPSLTALRLSYNNLTGPLPNSFTGSRIQNLWLNNQLLGFSGTIHVLSSMTQSSQVWLYKNQFTGPIPDLSNCTKLFDLQLRDNQFTGLVPPSLYSISSLQNISLANNFLQGPYPKFPPTVTKVTVDGTNSFCKNTAGSCDPVVTILLEVASALGYPIKLANSWQGNDACTNWNYITCSQGNIITVNLAKQQFGGTISPAFANLTSLRSLYLNDNNLTGSIPDGLATMPNLQTLDVSNNNLNGAIPKFASTLKLISTGNPSLGTTTPSSGSGGSGGTPSGSDSNSTTPGGSPSGTVSNGNSISPGGIAGVVIAVVIFVVVVLIVLIKCCVNKRHRKVGRVESRENGGVPSELQSHIDGGNAAISIQVLRQATNNFSEENILGRGGFGVVYKGELRNGTKIAVKRMESVAMRTRGLNEFQAEIGVLTKVRHRHLVAFLGYCMNGNERLLVYEYMPQGTLTQHLFENGSPPLSWKQRMTIALDVGRGVEYLHSLAQQSFIHRDLKPSNILLGDNMRAKVADFGLVKNAPDGKYSVETRLAGTFGYLAPEYAVTGRVTTKVDVYAFGVVLIQLITGRKALDDTMTDIERSHLEEAIEDTTPGERSPLVTWFHRVLINKENIPIAIDQTLNPDEETMESMYKVAELAGHCTAQERYQRPDMGHAVNILSPLVELWTPTSHEENMSLPQDHLQR